MPLISIENLVQKIQEICGEQTLKELITNHDPRVLEIFELLNSVLKANPTSK